MTQLCDNAQWTDILLALTTNSLLSVKTLADKGYTTIFHAGDKGASVHQEKDVNIYYTNVAVLQGWRDNNGLWQVPLVDNNDVKPQSIMCNDKWMHRIQNVYELPSTEKIIRFLRAELGFPTKAMLLMAIKNGNLTTFLGLTYGALSRFFPKSDKMQKGHMKQVKAEVRSIKVVNEDSILQSQPSDII